MRKLLVIIWIVFLAILWHDVVFGQTIDTVYVDTDVSGGLGDGSSWANAYSTLSSAEAGEQGDLVTATTIKVFSCRASAGTKDSTAVTIDGWTTSSDYYIEIGSYGEHRHSGVWDESKYRIEGSNTITINENNLKLIGLQGRQPNSGNYTTFECLSGITNTTAEFCLVRNSSTDNYASCIRNFSLVSNSIGISDGYGSALYSNDRVHNCTAIGGYIPIFSCDYVYNSISYGGSHGSYGIYGAVDGDYNIVDHGSNIGSNSFTGEPVFADADNDDYRLSEYDTIATQQGINLYADATLPVTTSIEGNVRNSTGAFDIGASHPLVMARVVDTDGTSGDFSSLSAAESSLQADLTAYAKSVRIECQATTGTADTTAVAIDGWTTSEDYYIEIGSYGANRHSGVWDDSKYRIISTSSSNPAIQNNINYTIIDGLQASVNSNLQPHVISIYGADYSTVSNCIVTEEQANQYGSRHGIHSGDNAEFVNIFNNIIYGISSTSSDAYGVVFSFQNNGYVYNNTVADLSGSSGSFGYYIYYPTADSAYLYNNIAQNCSTCFQISGSYLVADYNISSDTTASGSNSQTEVTLTFYNAASDDYHLHSTDTVAIDQGYDLSGTFTTDIDGETRSSWDIGADEYVAAGSSSNAIIRRRGGK